MQSGVIASAAMEQGVRLHVVEKGPADGPLVILLHGFPEFWGAWRRHMELLAQAGLRVVAPDQRGYNKSGRPADLAAYGLDRLTEDVVRLADERGRERFSVVGHDWGGVVAWRIAAVYPDRVNKLVVINAPHPVAARRYLRRHPTQMARSSYVLLFQLPALPERLLRAGNFRLLRQGLLTARPGTFDDRRIRRYRATWERPGALGAMLNWYRAEFRSPVSWPDEPVRPPALLIWGTGDPFLEAGLAEASLNGCADGRIAWIENATHWVHHEEPERVTEAILDHIA